MPAERRTHGGGAAELGQRLGFGCLLLALFWAPLPLGSNRPWAVALLGLIVWAGLACVAVAWLSSSKGGKPPQALRRSPALLILATGLCGWVALQHLLGSPEASLWVSEDRFANRHYLLRSLVFCGALLLSLAVVNSPSRARWLLGGVAVCGLLQALLAVGLHASGGRYEYLFAQFEQGHRATGTFFNPDHLAGYMELGISAGVGLLLSLLGPSVGKRRWREHLVAAADFLMSPKMLLRLALVVMVIALVLTHSRMGNGAFFISILLVGALVAVSSIRLRRPALWLVASMVIIDLVIIGQWVGLDKVAARMKGTAEASSPMMASFGLEGEVPPPREESLRERLMVPFASVPLITEHPVAGWGGGSYALAFAPIRPAHVYEGFWDHAHNDYVHVAVETGLVGFALWFGIGLLTAWRALPLLKDQTPSLNRGIGVAALMALSCIGLHSWVDFNLHIPANALTFAVLLSLVWVARALPAEPASRSERRSRQTYPQDDDR